MLPTNSGLLCPTYAVTFEAVRDGVLEADAETIESIHRQTMYLSKLVEDLRQLAETEAADFQLDLEPGLLEEVVSRSVEAFRPAGTI